MFSLTVKYKLPLAGMKVSIPDVEDYHNEFSIISTTRSFTLRAKYVLYVCSTKGVARYDCLSCCRFAGQSDVVTVSLLQCPEKGI